MQRIPNHISHVDLIDDYEEELGVTYREERYKARDNGAAYRLSQFQKRARPLDKQWTFGRQSPSTRYMLLAGVRVHRIVCSAFHGDPPTDQHVVDHIDTNRANTHVIDNQISALEKRLTKTMFTLVLGQVAVQTGLVIAIIQLLG